MAEHESLIQRLDTIIAILRLANRGELDPVWEATRSDPVSAAILDSASGDYVGSGALQETVSKSTKQSQKTVQRRIADLAAMGLLERRPSGRPAYRASPVFRQAVH